MLACASVMVSPAAGADSGTAKFVKNAAVGGMFEVQSSKVALSRTNDPRITNLAHMLVDDHVAANRKLKEIAAKESISVPSQLDARHLGDIDTLRKTKGPFAEPFIQMQRKAHGEAIVIFQRYADHGADPALKAFAKDVLPTLEKHRTAIGKVYSEMNGG
jgi:putative membrane protein